MRKHSHRLCDREVTKPRVNIGLHFKGGLGVGAAIASLLTYRCGYVRALPAGDLEQKTTAEGRLPVPRGLEVHFIPAFRLSFRVTWTRIANGEKVIDEVVTSPEAGLPQPAKSWDAESSNPVVP